MTHSIKTEGHGERSRTMTELKNFKKEFNKILAAWVNKAVKRCELLLNDEGLSAYIKHAEKLINRDGKRLRPYLMTLMYRVCDGSINKDVYHVGTILELFHNYALMHDDIVDLGIDRSGVITLHRYIKKELKHHGGVGDIEHIAEGQTIFVGDLILSWANSLWDDLEDTKPEKILTAKRLFYKMAEEAMLGEIIDIDMTARKTGNMELIRQKMNLKTSSYTFVRPMQIGACLAGSDKNILSFAEKFGTPLGTAFQIQDDLFDLTLTPDKKYKTVLSDMRTHQQTIFTQFILDSGSKKNKSELLALWGSDLTPADRPRVINLFKSSGALSYGIQEMNTNFEEALSVLEASQLPRKYKIELRELVNTIRNRTS